VLVEVVPSTLGLRRPPTLFGDISELSSVNSSRFFPHLSHPQSSEDGKRLPAKIIEKTTRPSSHQQKYLELVWISHTFLQVLYSEHSTMPLLTCLHFADPTDTF
jgi:hypothetical protein